MKGFGFLAVAALAVLGFAGTASTAAAQVSVNVQIGAAPVCPYGYYNYAPYSCAPFGYYGPQWFTSGVFIGAGPWFVGPVGFHGYIDREFDPRFGYVGPFPERGERPDWGRHLGWEKHWHGNEWREEYRHDNGNHNGEYKEHGNPHGDDRGNGHGEGHGGGDHGHGHGHGHDD